MNANEQVVQAATALTRQLQLERTLAALKVLRSPDAKTPNDWAQQTGRTDRYLREFLETLANENLDDQRKATVPTAPDRLTQIRRQSNTLTTDGWHECLAAYSDVIEAVLQTSGIAVDGKIGRGGVGKALGKVVIIQATRESASRLQTLLLAHSIQGEGFLPSGLLEISHLWTLASRFVDSPVSGLSDASQDLHAKIQQSSDWRDLRRSATAIITHQPITADIYPSTSAGRRDAVAEGIFNIEEEECRQILARMAQFRHDDKAQNMSAYTWAAIAILSELAVGALAWIIVASRRRLAHAHILSQESEARWRGITDSAQDAILMMDSQGRVTHWNPAAERMLGYTVAEAIGHNLHELVVPARYLESHRRAFPHFRKTGCGNAVNRTLELCARRKDGQEITVALSLSAIQVDGQWHAVGILRDETERKACDERLAYHRRKLQQILDTFPNGIYLVDQQHNIEYLNPYLESLFGPVGGQKCYQYFHDQTTPCPWCKAGRVFQSEDVRWELPFAKNGRVYELLNTSLKSEDGRLLNFGILQDITARKESEEALRGSEQRHRQLVEACVSGIAVHEMLFDPQGTPIDFVLLSANPAFEKQTGLSVKDILGRRVTEVLPGIDNSPFIEKFGRVVQTGEPMNFTEYCQPLDRHFLINAYRVGERQFAVVFQDVSDRIRVEEEQARAVQRMEALLNLNHMVDHPIKEIIAAAVESAVRVTGSEMGYLADVNRDEPALTMRYWSQSAQNASTVADNNVTYPIDAPGPWEEAMRQRSPIIINHEVVRPPHGQDTCEHFVPLNRHMTVPVFDGDNIVAVAGVGNKPSDYNERDLRQLRLLMEGLWLVIMRKRAAEDAQGVAIALESANKALEEFNYLAESAARAKSEFLANMSHEIRTPMTAILGYTELLANSVEHPGHREAVKIIQRNGDHLLTLINDILDLSKIEAGKLHVEHVACSPMAILSDVVSLMRVRSDAKGLSMRMESIEPLPESVMTDPTRLRQVLVNLVGNAIKFTEAGEVRLIAKFLDAETPSPRLCYEVVDTGIGMTTEQIQSLFVPFQQAEAQTTRRFGGTGLGLAISRRLATLLGGDITARSEPEKGSTFVLTIEAHLASDTEAASKPTDTASPDSNRKRPMELHCRVLLAEDGLDNQRLFSLLLKKGGAEVTVVENGQAAVQEALAAGSQGDPFDIILMDMQMPIMDGYEATRRLRVQGWTGPIIALTAHAMAEDRQKCLDAGCDDYLSKPIKKPDLLEIVARHTPARTWPITGDAPRN